MIPEEFRKAHDNALKRFREDGQGSLIGRHVELSGKRKNGETFPLELALGTWTASGRRYFSGIVRDISERKAIEGQLVQAQKMDALGILAGGMAHDLNNMLLPILTLVDLTAGRLPEGSKDRERLDKVMQAARRAKDLVARILAFSRDDYGLRQEAVAIHDVIRDTLELLRPTLPSSVTITAKLDENAGVVFADPGQISTVLLNLAANSADAMLGLAGRLDITLTSETINGELLARVPALKPGKWARLRVKDSGCGMKPEMLDRIFDPFFTTKAVGEGTGLGLAMAHGIVEKHGGVIQVASALGKGTTFNIYLPTITEEIDDPELVPSMQNEE